MPESDSVEKQVGQNLKGLRLRSGLTQMELAQRAGMSQHHLSQIENAKKSLHLRIMAKLCVALGCQITDLFNGVVLPGSNG